MSEIAKENERLLQDLLRRAFPPATTEVALHRMVAAFWEQRNTNPEPFAYDLRANEFLKVVAALSGPGTDPQVIINHLVELHMAA